MGANGFFQRADDARDRQPIGFIGDFTRNLDFKSISMVNSNPQAAQVQTITVPAAPDNATTYKIVIAGASCEFLTDASATQAELGEGLRDAINDKASARRLCVASYTGGVITLTGVWPGVAWTTTVNASETTQDLGAPTTTTTAADADTVSFGRAMVHAGYVTDEGTPKGYVPVSTDFTAQVETFTYGSVGAADEVFLEIEYQGKRFAEGVTYNASQTQTLVDLVTAMNIILDAAFGAGLSILLASDATTVTLTSDIAGSEFDAVSSVGGNGAGTVSKAYTTGPSTDTSLVRAMAGVSVRRLDVENLTIDGDDPAYAANQGVEVAVRGHGVVQRDTTETWAYGDDVYVSLAAATKGRFYNTAATSFVWIGTNRVKIQRQEYSTTSDGLGVINVDMGA
jgi:hypothetical protein